MFRRVDRQALPTAPYIKNVIRRLLKPLIREAVYSLEAARIKRILDTFERTGEIPKELTHKRVFDGWVKVLKEAGLWDDNRHTMKRMFSTWMVSNLESGFEEHAQREASAKSELEALRKSFATRSSAFKYPGIMGRYSPHSDPVMSLYYEGSEYTHNVKRYAKFPEEEDPIERFAAEEAYKRRGELVAAVEANIRALEEFRSKWLKVPSGYALNAVREAAIEHRTWTDVLDWLLKVVPRVVRPG